MRWPSAMGWSSRSANTEIIDLGDRGVLPGFVEPHPQGIEPGTVGHANVAPDELLGTLVEMAEGGWQVLTTRRATEDAARSSTYTPMRLLRPEARTGGAWSTAP